MKKHRFSRTGKVIKQAINIKNWADWSRVKSSTAYLAQGIKRLFVPDMTRGKNTSFDAVQARMNLTAGDLMERQKALFRLSVLMVVVAVVILSYSIYHLISGHIAAFLLSFVVSLLALTLAFRYHYWQYLIKTRKLSSSIREWYKQGLLGEKR